ncbi:hypothetical protein D3C76_1400320 [compost metagenome]
MHAVYSCKLPGQADALTNMIRFTLDVRAANPCFATIGLHQRREDIDRRRLARSIGAQQRENFAAPHLKIHSL